MRHASTLLALVAVLACNPTATGETDGGGASSGSSSGGGGGSSSSSSSSSSSTGGDGGTAAACGNGRLDPGEGCDDGDLASLDGCSGTCTLENGWACPLPGQDCVSTVVCGNSDITGTETCDDGNIRGGDGCGATCQVEQGWACPAEGAACEAARCGDGFLAGGEQCDDGTPGGGDGCTNGCQLESGYQCPTPGQPCQPTVCGDGVRQGTEQCDDDNHDYADGCVPGACTREPDCSASPASPCSTSCGDGIRLPNNPAEECEDGNNNAGDGCSPTCTVEPGFSCTADTSVPDTLVLPIVLRDFPVSHPDFEDFNGQETGIVADLLGSDGKPVYAHPGSTTATTTGQSAFDQWYRDVPGVNQTFVQTITLGRLGSGDYQFSNSSFFPLDGSGFGNEGNSHNFHFTSEVHYWFEYRGNETLEFTGDDDVWVFVNHRLAVDLGGVHGATSGSITLDGTAAGSFNLQVGRVYEIAVFQAERHTSESNYRLTLGNFLNGLSRCASICGDHIRTPDEACDDGVNDGSYGGCTSDCRKGPRCGDGTVQSPQEECDDGTNLSPYGGCAPGCLNGSTCGDGTVDSLFGEECDDGVNNGGYGACGQDCRFGGRCGDGHLQEPPEQCDDGNRVDGDGCAGDCMLEIGG